MTMPRKRALFILIPVLVLSAVWLFLVPSLARDRIEAFLTEAGQKRAAIGTLSVHPSYILATDIHLDTDGFNTIDRLKARIDFKTLSLRDVEIGTLSTAYEITGFPLFSGFKPFSQRPAGRKFFHSNPAQRLRDALRRHQDRKQPEHLF